ncbi:hypothetical protein CBR_g19889 [Chara braunii]|uniref:Integrase catalytic domain-containing protein n=1 Tax=Chara braunii TaxID=69332 RepID=A0A388KYY0_CHABU|nr:hypothetical protein CBR_g19889 [Chara braunii]|eukprot:GBG75255.1 hypothetical protein CBR_g19889 [Chara braunii]
MYPCPGGQPNRFGCPALGISCVGCEAAAAPGRFAERPVDARTDAAVPVAVAAFVAVGSRVVAATAGAFVAAAVVVVSASGGLAVGDIVPFGLAAGCEDAVRIVAVVGGGAPGPAAAPGTIAAFGLGVEDAVVVVVAVLARAAVADFGARRSADGAVVGLAVVGPGPAGVGAAPAGSPGPVAGPGTTTPVGGPSGCVAAHGPGRGPGGPVLAVPPVGFVAAPLSRPGPGGGPVRAVAHGPFAGPGAPDPSVSLSGPGGRPGGPDLAAHPVGVVAALLSLVVAALLSLPGPGGGPGGPDLALSSVPSLAPALPGIRPAGVAGPPRDDQRWSKQSELRKCRFAQHKVDFLGHYVSDQGLHMDDAKITAIAEWPAPTSAKQLRSFLGLTSYYSNFIRGYARYSYVLTSTLLRKNPPWAWTPLHEDAFRALKKAVTCAPVLHLPDFNRPFILTTDASDFAVGAVLSQVFPSSPDSSHPRIPRFPPPTPTTAFRLTPTRPATDEPFIDYSPTIAEDGTVESRSGDCPIGFYSRQLLPAEINYTADEPEVLAVVYAARHWRHYLHGAPFTVRTDNSVVQAFLTKPKLTPRQARWWRDLSEFSFTTEHIKGETNRVVDALSRRSDHDQEHIQLSSISVSTVHHLVIGEFHTQYRHCPDYHDIHATLRSGKTVPNYSLGDNGLVYWHGSQGTREPRICVPSTGQLRVRAVAEFHDQAVAGHMGFHKTLARVSRLYVWPKRNDFVKDYVAECPTCQEVNSANHLPYGLLQPLPIPEGRWQSISMDFIGPFRPPTPRGHDAILVVVDRFTKRARFVPCRYAISAREVADIVFDRVVRDHGLPPSIISDRNPRFTSRFWRRLHEVYDTQLRFSSSYHPQTDGQTEITNRALGNILRKIVRDDQQWDLHLAHVEIAYIHAVSPATGMSPYYCDLGYHPRVLLPTKDGSEKRAEFVSTDKLKQAIDAALPEANAAHVTRRLETEARSSLTANQREGDRDGRIENGIRYDGPQKVAGRNEEHQILYWLSIAHIKTPATRQFVSPRQQQLLANGKTPTKKTSPNPNGAGPSSVKKKALQGKDQCKTAARAKARRRILQCMQLSEDMLSVLQMDDLKQLCSMHNVHYMNMLQACVALRKIPGLIMYDTKDLPDLSVAGEEVYGANAYKEQSEESESKRRKMHIRRDRRRPRTCNPEEPASQACNLQLPGISPCNISHELDQLSETIEPDVSYELAQLFGTIEHDDDYDLAQLFEASEPDIDFGLTQLFETIDTYENDVENFLKTTRSRNQAAAKDIEGSGMDQCKSISKCDMVSIEGEFVEDCLGSQESDNPLAFDQEEEERTVMEVKFIPNTDSPKNMSMRIMKMSGLEERLEAEKPVVDVRRFEDKGLIGTENWVPGSGIVVEKRDWNRLAFPLAVDPCLCVYSYILWLVLLLRL